MATHKIVVEVNDKTQGLPTETSEVTLPTEIAPRKEVKEGKQPDLDAIANAAFYNMGKNLVLGSISRIGEASGDYYAQRTINNAMSISNYALAIGRGGVIGAAYTAIDIGFKIYDFNLQKAKAEINTDFYRQSVGVAALSGSRYKGRKI